MKKLGTLGALIVLSAILGLAPSAVSLAGPDDPLWLAAEQAYRSGDTEAGHRDLKQLIDQNPGDCELAVRCLEKIFRHARATWSEPWQNYALDRIAALERIGAVSANSHLVKQAFQEHAALRTSAFEFFEVAEDIDRVAEANAHDVFWRILQAQSHEGIGSLRTRPLYDALRADVDVDHPHDRTRGHWVRIEKNLERDRRSLPGPPKKLPPGSILNSMEPDDPDGQWLNVSSRPVRGLAEDVDRLIGDSLGWDQVVLWRDASGLMDPPRALDFYLRSQPPEDLRSLRKLQEERFRDELVSSSPREAEVLNLARRYSWSAAAQELLLKTANSMLWSGRAQSALRSFDDVLAHASDPQLIADASVGRWIALAQIGDLSRLDRSIEEFDVPNAELRWLGKRSDKNSIRRQLLEGRTRETSKPAIKLTGLPTRILRLPPISPWPTEMRSADAKVDLTLSEKKLFASARHLLASYDTSVEGELQPEWIRADRHHAGVQESSKNLFGGYFRPTFDGRVLYTRSGFAAEPRGIAALDRSTGQPLWSSTRGGSRSTENKVPLGDPALADGRLYWLQWNNHGNLHHTNRRRLSLVCFDPTTRRQAWEATVSEAGRSSDVHGQFESASPNSAVYGNRVTVHNGAIYACSNAGIISRSDIRDGRTDWLHFYRRESHGGSGVELGASPIIAGNLLICIPRDAGRVIALDLSTGRIAWENPLVLPIESLGIVDERLVIRGRTALVALDLETGQAAWHVPVSRTIGRSTRAGDSIYVSTNETLTRYDGRTGRVQETRNWDLEDERPQNFALSESALFVVTDRPSESEQTDAHLNASAYSTSSSAESENNEAPQLSQAWTLRRNDAQLSWPPKGSPLSGKLYVSSGGIVECVDSAKTGKIVWRRFLDWRDSFVRFTDESIVISRSVSHHRRGGRPSESSEVMTLDGKTGRVLWQRRLPLLVSDVVNVDGTPVFHDSRGSLVGVEPKSGDLLWERRFGRAELRVNKRVGESQKLNVVFSSTARARHVVIDAQSGRVESDHRVKTASPDGAAEIHGKRLDSGFYEIAFAPKEAQYVRLVALSEINGMGWTSIAEIEVVGVDGKQLDRSDWRVVSVSSRETKSRYDTSPETVFDDDPSTWWHTQWIGGIPRHPHHFEIDLGKAQQIRGLRYLPAVIINNNGMIRDYRLFASTDRARRGPPVAQGVLIDRMRLENPQISQNNLVFETRNHRLHTSDVFSYGLDGKPARRLAKDARVTAVGDRYVIVTQHRDGKDHLIALSHDDPDYRFDLGERRTLDEGRQLQLLGDRLVLSRRKIIVADLANQRFLVPPTSNSLARDKEGLVIRIGRDHLLKIVHQGNTNVAYRIDLRDGVEEVLALPDQSDPFRSTRQSFQSQPSITQGGFLLLYDGSALTAWNGSHPQN